MTGPGWIASVSPALSLGVIVASAVGSCLAGVRWLRVAQREHYLAGSTTRFAWRWWTGPGFNRLLLLAGVFGVLVSPTLGLGGLAVAGLVAVGPLGLGLRGRTSKLKWTPRLFRVAVVAGTLEAGGMVGSYLSGQGRWLAPMLSVAVPGVIDVACRLLAPVEDRLAARFVAEASVKLARVAPVVVAITGSYGKTSTKGYVAHLVGSTRTVVASPSSFNNRAGLSRAINEGLVLGTEVFVAEMGTYGPGEIAELCEWIPPTVAVITAIGPVHLERFGSEDQILGAKAEITDKAATVVLNVDDERLRSLVAPLEAQGKKVWDVSVLDPKAAVHLKAVGRDRWVLFLRGEMVAEVPITAVGPTNVACAVAVAVELGVGPHQLAQLLPGLPVAANRLTQSEGTGGFVILDDTYNSNPAGARAGLGRLAQCGSPEGRRAVVTPGMVELGHRQFEENQAFARQAIRVVDDLVIVGRTNRAALLAGAAEPDVLDEVVGSVPDHQGHAQYAKESQPPSVSDVRPTRVVLVSDRDEAVSWVRDHLGPGDAVLYENDLPDHFP